MTPKRKRFGEHTRNEPNAFPDYNHTFQYVEVFA